MKTGKLILSIAVAFAFSQLASAEGVFIDGDFAAAKTSAKAADKFVMIDFKAEWCGPCKMLDRTTWKDEDVISAINDKAIAVKVDVDRRGDLASRYGIRSIPTVIFVDSSGNEVSRFVGYRDAEGFLKEISKVGKS